MALSDYDPKLLNFLYELTKLDKPMSYRNIARNVYIEGKNVSAKTVERWFDFLRKGYDHPSSKTKHRFDYFPKFYYEKLGLVYVYVISDTSNSKVLQFAKLRNYQNYAAWLYDPRLNKKVLLTGYLIPLECVKKLKSIFEGFVKSDTIMDYEMHILPYSARMIYSPWHKLSRGVFSSRKDEEIAEQVDSVIEHFYQVPDIKLDDEIKSNPLIVPVLFESWREHKSSHALWDSLRKRLGNKLESYVGRTERNDALGIKMVQKTLRDINRSGLVHSMKLVYLPVQLDNSFIYTAIDFKDKEELSGILYDLSANSLQCTVNLDVNKRKLFCVALVRGSNLSKIFSVLVKTRVQRLMFLQHEESLSLLTNKKYMKFNYARIFDPTSCKWSKL